MTDPLAAMNEPTIPRSLRPPTAEPDDRTNSGRAGIVDRTRLERRLWIAVAIAIVADVTTTLVGLTLGLTESNPAGVAAIEIAGVLGLLAVKAAAVGVGLAVAIAVVRAPDRIAPDYVTLLVPTALASVWLLAAAWNAVLLGLVLTGP